MSGGKWCLCPNTQTQLWTSGQSWHERLVNCGSRVQFQWRCNGCKTKRSVYVDSLWRKTFISAGGTPSCELGCIGGPVHFGRECGRPIEPFSVLLKAVLEEPEPTIRVSLASGPDFVKVSSAHRTRAVFLDLPVTEEHAVGSSSVTFSVGVCILPTCVPGSILPATYRTMAFIDGAPVPCGKLPYIFRLSKRRARVVDSVKFRGAPLGAFLGISADAWGKIWKQPCAMRRYASIIYGHTAKNETTDLSGCETFAPLISVPVELCPRPRPVAWRGNYVCGYCGKHHKTREAFIAECAPELPA
jgi:hypothetical protein